jgi:hypothetical protein
VPDIIQSDALGESHGLLVDPQAEDGQDDDYRPFPFRRILPIAQVLLCALLLFPYRESLLWAVLGVRSAPTSPAVASTFRSNPDGTLDFSPNPEFEQWMKAKDYAYDAVSLLNLPGVFPQVPFMILRDRHDELRIEAIDFKTWRVITWPVLALPFWWMAGRGLEALIAARRGLIFIRIGWMSTVISFLLMAGGLTITIGFLFAGKDRADPISQLMAGSGLMWGVLASLTVAAKIAQWRLRKGAISQ